jgi:hypothetical protein
MNLTRIYFVQGQYLLSLEIKLSLRMCSTMPKKINKSDLCELMHLTTIER